MNKKRKLLLIGFAVFALMAVGAAEKNLQPGTVTVYDPGTGATIASFEAGASNTPLEVNPGDSICFTAVIENVGDVAAPAHSYNVGFIVKSGPEVQDRLKIMRPKTIDGQFSIDVGEEVTITDVCSSIRETAAEGTYPLWIRPFDLVSNGPYIPDGQIYENAIKVLDSPTHDSIDPEITWSLSWDPSAAKQGTFLDISMHPVITAVVTVSNGAGADIPFEGRIECTQQSDWNIAGVPPGASEQNTISWGDSLIQTYSPGEKMTFICSLYDSSGTLLEYIGYWPTARGSNIVVVRIQEISLDEDAYAAGESGTARLIIKNIDNKDVEAGSIINMRLEAFGTTIEDEDIPFTLASGETKTITLGFTVPDDLGLFVDEMTQCFSIDSVGMDYTTMQLYHSTAYRNSPPDEICYTITPASVSDANCGELTELDGIPQQSCTCASQYCILESPEGYFIESLDYSYPGSDYVIRSVRTKAELYNFNHGAMTVNYGETAVPSMELNILCLGLLLTLGGFFHLRWPKDE